MPGTDRGPRASGPGGGAGPPPPPGAQAAGPGHWPRHWQLGLFNLKLTELSRAASVEAEGPGRLPGPRRRWAGPWPRHQRAAARQSRLPTRRDGGLIPGSDSMMPAQAAAAAAAARRRLPCGPGLQAARTGGPASARYNMGNHSRIPWQRESLRSVDDHGRFPAAWPPGRPQGWPGWAPPGHSWPGQNKGNIYSFSTGNQVLDI